MYKFLDLDAYVTRRDKKIIKNCDKHTIMQAFFNVAEKLSEANSQPTTLSDKNEQEIIDRINRWFGDVLQAEIYFNK